MQATVSVTVTFEGKPSTSDLTEATKAFDIPDTAEIVEWKKFSGLTDVVWEFDRE